MKRLNLLLMLFVLVSAQQPVRASSSDGYGAKAYAAGAIATAGLVGGGYKLMRNYQARQTEASTTKDQMNVKIDRFNKVFESSRQKLQDQLMSFLELSGETYDACMEHVDKFQELSGKFEEMIFKIEHAHHPYIKGKAYSERQKKFLDTVKSLLKEVIFQRDFAARWGNELDKSYEDFIACVAMMFEDEINFKPKFSATLIEWQETLKKETGKPDEKVWVKKTYESSSVAGRWTLVKTLKEQLPDSGVLQQIGIELKRNYNQSASSYEQCIEIYNKQYGSYFTKFKGYFSGYFKSKPTDVPVPVATAAPEAVPASVPVAV